MGALDGRVAIVTGAARGLGRAHALRLAAEGASVVVNDLGAQPGAPGATSEPDGAPGSIESVVSEIGSMGGRVVAAAFDVSDWSGAEEVVGTALAEFGDVHILVNNAGNLRDRMLVSMTEADWDDVVRVHLKGHAGMLHFAAAHWREQAKAGHDVRASVVNTTSTSGLLGNPGQSNYGAAKAGVAALTVIAAEELGRYGVRVNAVAPAARTRMTETTPGLAEIVRPPSNPSAFDVWDPENVSPLVAYLATSDCPITGKVFFVQGGRIRAFDPWALGATIEKDGRWNVDELAGKLPTLEA